MIRIDFTLFVHPEFCIEQLFRGSKFWGVLCRHLQYTKVSVHLMITIQKVTSNVQSVPRHSPDIY
jgi:hypothetical protein